MELDISILAAVIGAVALLLIMILKLKLPAFISLLIASIAVGVFSGLDSKSILDTVQQGMGSTLGFVATVVGLGALFGGILELSGGAMTIAKKLQTLFGEEKAGLSLGLTGFLVAIPVFFDVAFIILIPVIYAMQGKSQKSLLHYGIPLLSGLAVTHAFIPPTPGPIAMADILGADLGWVILAGLIAGFPAMIVSGLLFGKFIGNKIFIPTTKILETSSDTKPLPSFITVMSILGLPIVLIMLSTLCKSGIIPVESNQLSGIITLIGHPFVALVIANVIAWYLLGRGQGYSSQELLDVSSKSMKPAGVIILLTGAGGAFKQMLIETKAGEMMATGLAEAGMPIIVFAFIAACFVRVVQGSATVAMITGAGLVSPLVMQADLSNLQLAAIVTAIASGASIFSHVNDSGFWLVKEYLGMTEKQTFQSWTIMTTILALVGFLMSLLMYVLCE